MKKLSVIIITRNEERDLPACLESVKDLADEIVVVDNHSSDKTREIAARYTDKIQERDWSGYGAQKQFALDQSTGDWVLNMDADERVTAKLAQEVKELLTKEDVSVNGYVIPFRVFFMGRRLRFGGCAGETHLRLFRRGKGRYGSDPIHEGITVHKPHGRLVGAMEHHSYHNFSEYLSKSNEYTGLIAAKKHKGGQTFSIFHNARLLWEFVLRYVVKGGFLDGQAGFTYAVLSSYYAWLKHVRLLDFERGAQ